MRWASALTITPFALAALGSLSCGSSTEPADVGGGADVGTQDTQPVDIGMGPDAQVMVDMGGGMDAAADAGQPADMGGPADTGNQNCSYPAGSNGSFMVGNILTPFSWATSLDGIGVDRPLDLEQVHCNTDPNMDWSPFDILVFVSIPAW